jgi:hypothetical protein
MLDGLTAMQVHAASLIIAVCSGRWRLIARQPMITRQDSVVPGFNRLTCLAVSNHPPTLARKALSIAMCVKAPQGEEPVPSIWCPGLSVSKYSQLFSMR